MWRQTNPQRLAAATHFTENGRLQVRRAAAASGCRESYDRPTEPRLRVRRWIVEIYIASEAASDGSVVLDGTPVQADANGAGNCQHGNEYNATPEIAHADTSGSNRQEKIAPNCSQMLILVGRA
jgi:hypothetical protein